MRRINDYKCMSCGCVEERMVDDKAPLAPCKDCGKEVIKLIAAPRVKFVGAGWESNDHLDFWANTREKEKELGGDIHHNKDTKD